MPRRRCTGAIQRTGAALAATPGANCQLGATGQRIGASLDRCEMRGDSIRYARVAGMTEKRSEAEERAGVRLTNLDQELFEGAQATKRDLVGYLDAVRDLIIPGLADRPLSVIRVLRGQAPFMQKNVPKYTPEFVRTVTMWAESSHREVSYALCNDRQTLLWFANQHAVEYHPTLVRTGRSDSPDFVVLDIDPPAGAGFGLVVQAALLVREALTAVGLQGAVKTSGA